jgi:hypothetical protein
MTDMAGAQRDLVSGADDLRCEFLADLAFRQGSGD